MRYGSALERLDTGQRRLLLHIFGADVFIYGKRLSPSFVRAMLDIDELDSLQAHAHRALKKVLRGTGKVPDDGV